MRATVRTLMRRVMDAVAPVVSAPGIGGIVLAVVYRGDDGKDEVGLVVAPHRAGLEDAVRESVLQALQFDGEIKEREEYVVRCDPIQKAEN